MKINPIALRELHLEGDKTKTFKVEVYEPKKISDGTYRCQIHIEGAPDGINTVDFPGQDSYQALTSALQALPVMVDVYNKQYMNSKLRWFPGDENLYFKLDLLSSSKT